MTTELQRDPSPPGFGFVYDRDTSVLPNGKTRVLGYSRQMGKGAVTYIALKVGEGLKPTREYLDHLLAGKDLLPAAYWEKLKGTPTLD